MISRRGKYGASEYSDAFRFGFDFNTLIIMMIINVCGYYVGWN